jgi:hypothetical protein
VDDRVASATGDDHPVVNVLRLQKDIASRSRIGLAYTDRIDGSNWNRVGSVDGRVVFGRNNVAFQLGQSATREFGTRRDGPIWMGRFVRTDRLFGVRYEFSGVDPDFRSRSGFIRRVGDVNLNLINILTLTGKPGSLVERFTPDISLYGTWTYDQFAAGQGVRDQKIHFNLNATLRGGWSAGGSLLLEKFGYDERIYQAYALEAPAAGGGLDTIAFTGTPKIPNRDWVVSMGTPEFQGFSASGWVLWGQDENFYEWASADIFFADLGLNWRPTNTTSTSGGPTGRSSGGSGFRA